MAMKARRIPTWELHMGCSLGLVELLPPTVPPAVSEPVLQGSSNVG